MTLHNFCKFKYLDLKKYQFENSVNALRTQKCIFCNLTKSILALLEMKPLKFKHVFKMHVQAKFRYTRSKDVNFSI